MEAMTATLGWLPRDAQALPQLAFAMQAQRSKAVVCRTNAQDQMNNVAQLAVG